MDGWMDATYAVLTREVKVPQNLLVDAHPRLVHPRRDPLLLLALPIPPHLRVRHPTPPLLGLALPDPHVRGGGAALAPDREGTRAFELRFRPRRVVLLLRAGGRRRDVRGGFLESFRIRRRGGGGFLLLVAGGGQGGFGDFVRVGAEGEGLLGARGGT